MNTSSYILFAFLCVTTLGIWAFDVWNPKRKSPSTFNPRPLQRVINGALAAAIVMGSNLGAPGLSLFRVVAGGALLFLAVASALADGKPKESPKTNEAT